MATNKQIKTALGLRDGASGRQVENAAIREWIAGGHELLDSLELANRLNERLHDQPESSDSRQLLRLLKSCRDQMLQQVRDLELEEQC
jgi:hypothetical protein